MMIEEAIHLIANKICLLEEDDRNDVVELLPYLGNDEEEERESAIKALIEILG